MSDQQDTVSNHGYNTPPEGTVDWHIPLNDNFRQIDRDVEIRDIEANRGNYDPADGAKFFATDSGKVYIGDGSSWSRVTTKEEENWLTIHCYDDNGSAYAETATETFSGDDIFDAAQQAIDSQIADNLSERLEYGRPLHQAQLDVWIEPGVHEVSNGLSITEPGVEMISIRGTGKYGSYVRCPELSDAQLIKIDPGAGTAANDRIRRVNLSNFAIDYRSRKDYDGATDTPRDRDGIYLNDITHCSIEDIEARGFATALTVRNCWQGRCANAWFSKNGSSSLSKPAIKVEGGRTAENPTQNATNHWLFSHIQGGHGHTQYAFFEFDRKTQQILIHSPNLEMGKLKGTTPTFRFRNSDNLSRSNLGKVIVSDAVLGGNPVFELNDTTLWVTNSEFYGPQLIDGTDGYNYVYLSNIEASLANGNNGIEMTGGTLMADNLLINNGVNALHLKHPQVALVSNCLFAKSSDEAIKFVDTGSSDWQVRQIRNVAMRDVGTDTGHAITIDGTDNVTLDSIVASIDSTNADSVVNVQFSKNTSVRNVESISDGVQTMSIGGESTFRQLSGAASVESGSRSVTVTHRLSSVPGIGDIQVTPGSSLGNASSWHVTNVTADTFDIALDTAPGKTVTFGWQAEL